MMRLPSDQTLHAYRRPRDSDGMVDKEIVRRCRSAFDEAGLKNADVFLAHDEMKIKEGLV